MSKSELKQLAVQRTEGQSRLNVGLAATVEQDAARYRWLRNEALQDAKDKPFGIAIGILDKQANENGNFNIIGWSVTYEEDADSAIDAAMASMEPTKIMIETMIIEENKKFRGLLLWALYHHQGGSSTIGQPIRKMLGIREHDKMTHDQIEEAQIAGGVIETPNVELRGDASRRPS